MFSFRNFKNMMYRKFLLERKTAAVLYISFFVLQLLCTFLFNYSGCGWVFFLCIVLAISMFCFSEYSDNHSRIEAMMLPAGNFEKYAVEWTWAFLLLPLATFATLGLAEILGSMLHYLIIDPWPEKMMWYSAVFTVKELSWILFLLMVEAITFAGAAMFRRFAALKTWSIAVGYSLAMLIAFATIFYVRYGEMVAKAADASVSVGVNRGSAVVNAMGDLEINTWWADSNVVAVYYVAIALFMMVWSYFRLKEEEA